MPLNGSSGVPGPRLRIQGSPVDESVDTHAVFTLTLTQALTAPVSANLSLAGSATETADYNTLEVSSDGTNYSPATTVTFAAGVTTMYARVTLVDDPDPEYIETIILQATVISNLGTRAASGTVLLSSDEVLQLPTPTLSITTTQTPVLETSSGFAQWTLSLSDNPIDTVVLNLALSGTATAGSDFGPLEVSTNGATWVPASTVSFLGNDRTVHARVQLLDDQLVEPDETIILTATVASGSTNNSSVSGTIILQSEDASPTLTLVADETPITEDTTYARWTANLNRVPLDTVTLSIAATGTATPGSDYSVIEVSQDNVLWEESSSVAFGSGSTAVYIRVRIINDPAEEPNETIVLTTTVATGTVTNSSASATVTITANDAAVQGPATEVTFDGTEEYFTLNTPYSAKALPVVTATTTDDTTNLYDPTAVPLAEIGRNGSNYFTGALETTTLTVSDSSPLIGATLQPGSIVDGSPVNGRFCQLTNSITIPAGQDFEFEWWYEVNNSVLGFQRPYEGTGEFRVNGAENNNPDRFRIADSTGSLGDTNILPTTVGRHVKVKVARVGTEMRVWLYDQLVASGNDYAASNGSFVIDRIGHGGAYAFGKWAYVSLVTGGTNYAWDNVGDTTSILTDSGPNGNDGQWHTSGSTEMTDQEALDFLETMADNPPAVYDLSTAGTIPGATLVNMDATNWSGSTGPATYDAVGLDATNYTWHALPTTPITLSGNHRVSFRWIRQNTPNAAQDRAYVMVGNSLGDFIELYDTDATGVFRYETSPVAAGNLTVLTEADHALGDGHDYVIECQNGTCTLSRDGSEIGTFPNDVSTSSLVAEAFYNRDTSNPANMRPVGGFLLDLKLELLDVDGTTVTDWWHYPNQNDTGLQVADIGPNGNHLTWTDETGPITAADVDAARTSLDSSNWDQTATVQPDPEPQADPTLTIAPVQATVVEGVDSFAQWTLSLDIAPSDDVSLSLVVSGTANNPADYNTLEVSTDGTNWSTASTVTFTSPDQTVHARVTIVPDSNIEPNKTIILTANVTSGTTDNASANSSISLVSNESGTYPNIQLTQTAAGYTTLAPTATSRVIYVSSSEGDNANDGLSELTPKQTLGAAYGLMRDGFPDWVCLKCGDTWTDEGFGIAVGHSGLDAANPAVITSYGSGPRPIIERAGSGRAFNAMGNSPSFYWAFVGIEYYNYNRNPDDPRYDTPQDNGGELLRWYRPGGEVLVEDCVSRFAGESLNIQDLTSTSLVNFSIRHCIIRDAYSSQGGGDHSQGMYIAIVNGLLIEECIFDHNGWNETAPNAQPTIFNHNIYSQGSTWNVTVRNNFTMRPSSHGMQCRTGGQLTGNVAIRCPISMLCGVNGVTGEDGSTLVADNIVLQGTDIDVNNERGWAIDLGGGSLATVDNNIIANVITTNSARRGINDPQGTATVTGTNIEYNWAPGTEDGSAWVDPDRTPESFTDFTESTTGSTFDDFLANLVAGKFRGSTSDYNIAAFKQYIRDGFVEV